MPTNTRLEFWFDFASPYSYLSMMRIESLVDKTDLTIHWRPFLLGAVFNKFGWNDSPFNVYPLKGKYMWRDIERLADDRGLPFVKPSQFPRNGLLASRVALAAADQDWINQFIALVFRVNFELDRDIATTNTVSECLSAVGQEPEPWMQTASSGGIKDRLRTQTDRAFKLGIFGAPTFVTKSELFWGDDRLENAIDWARRPSSINS